MDFSGQVIAGPESQSDAGAWLEELRRWRAEQRLRIGYDGSDYARPELRWTQRNFVHTLLMVEDRYFYDPATGQYTVDRYLDDLETRYGGVDSVLIWHAYPNIGIDDCNQHDLLRDLPGGLGGLRQAIADFHRRGVRVLFPAMPWDHGTREEHEPYWVVMARTLTEIGADGLMGDTMLGVPHAFHAACEQLGSALAIEPENGLGSDEALAWNTMTWGYWGKVPPFVPPVSKFKWLESRHMVHVCSRWDHDRIDRLQFAFFNGVGYIAWENVWGTWNGFTSRAAEALRRIRAIERAFAHLLTSPDWEPHTHTHQYGVFASKFKLADQTLWTIVNRNDYTLSGAQLQVSGDPDVYYFDVWNEVPLTPEVCGETAVLSFDLEAKGFGAVLAISGEHDRVALPGQVRSSRPLAELSHEWAFLPQQIVEIRPTEPVTSVPPGMVRIPSARFDFRVSGIEVEGENAIGVDVQYPWEDSPRRHHRHTLDIRAFYIDRYPVTNAEFKVFLESTHYAPEDSHNFLKDWIGGAYPSGYANKPVTWVSIEDARAYAEWAGKRLPHEWEWQYAAQGTDARLYLWGNTWNSDAVPEPEKGRRLRGPSEVSAHPAGASPFGVMDTVGNVWQWTDEYRDEHTRAAILRGGSYYQPQGSSWYFPQAYRLTEHGKYLLMAPGRDRAGTIGFRCVRDTA